MQVLNLIPVFLMAGLPAAHAAVQFSLPYNINGIAGSSSSAGLTSLDYSDAGGNTVFMTQSFASPRAASGLPDGFGASGSTGNNVLQLGVHGFGLSASVGVPSGYYSSLDILALGISGGDYLTVTLNYADGTSPRTVTYVPDWYGQGSYNRYSLNSGTVDARGFGYADVAISADPAKALSGITLQSSYGRTDVLEATGNEVAAVPEPNSLALIGSAVALTGVIRRRPKQPAPADASTV
ncbi:MAG TPA: PEP-CTERM sorting domain-containing protein [Rhodopila sp.]|nr:PEP-CTERM sorting domain-containing protein [Rhodopila sp.]